MQTRSAWLEPRPRRRFRLGRRQEKRDLDHGYVRSGIPDPGLAGVPGQVECDAIATEQPPGPHWQCHSDGAVTCGLPAAPSDVPGPCTAAAAGGRRAPTSEAPPKTPDPSRRGSGLFGIASGSEARRRSAAIGHAPTRTRAPTQASAHGCAGSAAARPSEPRARAADRDACGHAPSGSGPPAVRCWRGGGRCGQACAPGSGPPTPAARGSRIIRVASWHAPWGLGGHLSRMPLHFVPAVYPCCALPVEFWLF